MEEIKLPKFKTKEELEQFAMGLMTENESLKNVIKRKDATIKELDATADKCTKDKFMAESALSLMKGANKLHEERVQQLESQVENLKKKSSTDNYKELYERCLGQRDELSADCIFYQEKFNSAKSMVRKLLSMVTFMYGLMPRFKAKRVYHAFGKFNAADYCI